MISPVKLFSCTTFLFTARPLSLEINATFVNYNFSYIYVRVMCVAKNVRRGQFMWCELERQVE